MYLAGTVLEANKKNDEIATMVPVLKRNQK